MAPRRFRVPPCWPRFTVPTLRAQALSSETKGHAMRTTIDELQREIDRLRAALAEIVHNPIPEASWRIAREALSGSKQRPAPQR